MTYAVSILRRAQKELQHLPREDYERVRDAIRALAHEPRPAGCLVLTGRVTLSSQPTVWLELLGKAPSYVQGVHLNYLALGQDT